MKRNLCFFVFLAILASLQCKKSNDGAAPSAKSQWTFSGAATAYTAAGTIYESSTNELIASDSNGNFARIFFSSPAKPLTNGTLTVLDWTANFSSSTQCSLQVGNLYDTNPVHSLSTGKTGDIVTLTVSASGKLTASFSGISVKDGSITRTVSGTLIEQ